MKIIRFLSPDGSIHHGVRQTNSVQILADNIFSALQPTGEIVPLESIKLLAPVLPRTLFCVGKNYRDHAAECPEQTFPDAPLLFFKTPLAVNGPESPVFMPRHVTRKVDFEAELAVVIGKTTRRVSEADAMDSVFGFTCANDVSARDCQFADDQWARGKSLDGFCPLGPWIETDADVRDAAIIGRLNGKIMQTSRTSDMIFSIPRIISHFSQGMTLSPGDVILTGTPSGCGFARKPEVYLADGDVYAVEIENVGTLTTQFRDA